MTGVLVWDDLSSSEKSFRLPQYASNRRYSHTAEAKKAFLRKNAPWYASWGRHTHTAERTITFSDESLQEMQDVFGQEGITSIFLRRFFSE